jgi:hypothetical protein
MDQADSLQKSDDELLAIVNQKCGAWINQDGIADTLMDAIVRAALISGRGRTPYRLAGPGNVMVDHEQMLRLWERLGIVVAKPLPKVR